jgi:hypothetical protein
VWLATLITIVLVFSAAWSRTSTDLTTANYATDSGDLLAAILTGGIPHPSGYPTYVLLGILAQHIPIGTPYQRAALVSSLPISLAAGLLVYWLSRHVFDADKWSWAGLVCGLAWGTAPLVMSQAVVVEVYGLHALFVLLSLIWVDCLVRFSENGVSGWQLVILAGSFGLGLGNHLTLVLCLPACLAATYSAYRNGLPSRLALGQFVALICGLLVYLYLPLRAQAYPPINWGNPQTWTGFWWVVAGEPYQTIIKLSSFAELLSRIGAWFNLLRQQFGLLGLVAAAIGAIWLSETERSRLVITGWIAMSYSFFAILYGTADSVLYLIPALLAVAYWIGCAVQSFRPASWRGIPWGWILGSLIALFFLTRLPGTLDLIDARKATHLADWAKAFLVEAPENALMLTQSDPDTFSLWYYHYGLGLRPDVAIISKSLTQYDWYVKNLIKTYPELNVPVDIAHHDSLEEYLLSYNPSRPICRSHVTAVEPLTLAYSCNQSP